MVQCSSWTDEFATPDGEWEDAGEWAPPAANLHGPSPIREKEGLSVSAGRGKTRSRARRPPVSTRAKPSTRDGAARAPFRIRRATIRDVPTIVAMVRRLGAYERLSHEVRATPARFRRDGFRRRPYFRVLLCC